MDIDIKNQISMMEISLVNSVVVGGYALKCYFKNNEYGLSIYNLKVFIFWAITASLALLLIKCKTRINKDSIIFQLIVIYLGLPTILGYLYLVGLPRGDLKLLTAAALSIVISGTIFYIVWCVKKKYKP